MFLQFSCGRFLLLYFPSRVRRGSLGDVTSCGRNRGVVVVVVVVVVVIVVVGPPASSSATAAAADATTTTTTTTTTNGEARQRRLGVLAKRQAVEGAANESYALSTSLPHDVIAAIVVSSR